MPGKLRPANREPVRGDPRGSGRGETTVCAMRMLLVSTYELGHQPLHVASPAGELLRAGHEVRCADLSVEPLETEDVRWADAVALSVPMHTAMRIAVEAARQVRELREDLPVCVYGLYAQLAQSCGGRRVADVALAGEYEHLLLEWADEPSSPSRATSGTRTVVDLRRSSFGLPARHLLPALENYARLSFGAQRHLAGYVEASHGCAHRCRHCPVPVVYDGRTRLVGIDAVLADVDQLVGLGARHISFGDPDFLNGPHHAMRVLSALHGSFPDLTFDVTAKVEHVLSHETLWPEFARAGCSFVVSAFESTSAAVLRSLAKGHVVDDEVEAVRVLRASGIEPRPSFVPFTPWTEGPDVLDLLDLVARCDLIGNVDPVQYSIRLLVPPGSLLLASGALEGLTGDYDSEHLSWTWRSGDARLDELAGRIADIARLAGEEAWPAERSYEEVRAAAFCALGARRARPRPKAEPRLRSPIPDAERPRLTEAWFCCAEPTSAQLRAALIEPAGACAP